MKYSTINSPGDAVIKAASLVCDRHKEHFIGLYLNSRLKCVKSELVSLGTLTAALVHPRETFRPALMHHADSIIVLHNHPSGNLEPSAEDIAMNQRLREAGKILGIELNDNIIFVTKTKFYSFREEGIL
ncbi:MAG: DNA repair protein RadC [Calditrichaeota bacterium]|nr:DNA repair protein RadC [Calditrichota bacterium]MCB0294626.1 DNA repair protein RadC [Calditrichota bacterium]MCB0302165.1 DNA repair protein RadC [Calditrichota bacterium]MCB0313692.1 DNA repair protein RadC [Calditrichota bacterium]